MTTVAKGVGVSGAEGVGRAHREGDVSVKAWRSHPTHVSSDTMCDVDEEDDE